MKLAFRVAAASLILFAPFPVNAHKVIGISDGDTLTLLVERKPIKIRLANIDAPEKQQAFGQRAKESLSALCWGKDAQYVPQNQDRYGRTVAVVTCGGVEVNRAQVQRGLAWVYTQYNKDPDLPGLEREARTKQAGLWSERRPIAPWEFRHPSTPISAGPCLVGPRGGHYQIVNGRKQYGCH